MASTAAVSPQPLPARISGRRNGALLMLSIPPATTISASPSRIDCAARAMAFIPEAQTMLTVTAAVLLGSPARMAAWRAGLWPIPAEMTLPSMTSSTREGCIPPSSTARAMTDAASRGAVKVESAPMSLPVGVRQALTITTFFIVASLSLRRQTCRPVTWDLRLET